MLKNFLIWIFICYFLTTFFSCIKEKEEEGTGNNIQEGDLLPVFRVEMNNGDVITTSSLENKVSVIILFTTECKDCRLQLPEIDKLYTHFESNENVVIVGISREDGEASVSGYWEDEGLTLPYSAQDDRTIYNLFATSVVPRIYISNQQRKVCRLFIEKPTASFETLLASVNELLD